jgi:UTP--glucose-1-phosphate uridylyltransferase
MQPLTHGAPKELLPVGGVPVLRRVLEECAASGVRDVLIVVAPGKDALEAYARPLAGMPGLPARVDFVVQREPHGLADAIRLGRDFAAGDPVAVALPDNLFVGGPPAVAQVCETYAREAMSVVGVTEVQARDAARRGPTSVYPGVRVGAHLLRIERIPDKGEHDATFDTGGAVAALTGVGRYVFTSEVFDAIDEVERSLQPGAELDDIPVMQQLLARRRLVGRILDGRFLDVGLPAGYEEANALFAAAASG